MFEVLLVGQIDDPTFQRAITAAEWAQKESHIKLEIIQLYQMEWKSWLQQNRQKYNAWNDDINHLVVINGKDKYRICNDTDLINLNTYF